MSRLRRALRRIVPEGPRRVAARARRALRDRADGTRGRLALRLAPPWDGPAAVCVTQAIRQSPLWEGKLANLQLGAVLLDGVLIAPGEVFSFWHWIGPPLARRGFAVGRAIRADRATGDPGGGLCQLSGIIYELGLRAGLTVRERHPHSRDLYESEAERFTPLGLDATVVWPWKDLRLENTLGVPVVLRLSVQGLELRAALDSDGPVAPQPLELERRDAADHRRVVVRRGAETVSDDRYAI